MPQQKNALPRKKKKALKDKTKHNEQYWQDIFDSIDLEVLPVQYMNSIIITFNDGKVWDVDIKSSTNRMPLEDIEDALDELFMEYEDSITNIDFRMDMDRLKTELSKRVHRFIKLNK